jgi:hypothetical protein
VSNKPNMVPGFNHNIKHQGRIYHVQTEDSGAGNPHIITHLFVGGNILATKKTSYADIVQADNLHAIVRELMQEQHKAMLRNLINGVYDNMAAPPAGPLEQAGGPQPSQPPPSQPERPQPSQPPPAQPERPQPGQPPPAQRERPQPSQPPPAQPERPQPSQPPPAQPERPQPSQPPPAQPERPQPSQPPRPQEQEQPVTLRPKAPPAAAGKFPLPAGSREAPAAPSRPGATGERPTEPARPAAADERPTEPVRPAAAQPPPAEGTPARSPSAGGFGRPPSSTKIHRPPAPERVPAAERSGARVTLRPGQEQAQAKPAAGGDVPPEVLAARRMTDKPKPKDTSGPTIFGENLISEKSLDEVILGYLAGSDDDE